MDTISYRYLVHLYINIHAFHNFTGNINCYKKKKMFLHIFYYNQKIGFGKLQNFRVSKYIE